MKRVNKLLGDGPWLARSDGPPIDLSHRNHLGPCAGEEALVGDVQVMALDGLFDDGNLAGSAKLDHDAPGDALEDAVVSLGGLHLPVADDEDIVRRAFG